MLSLRYQRQFDKPSTADLEPDLLKSNLVDPNLTIVQPILSGDPLLKQCLEHHLKWSEVSFLWLIDEDDLEAQTIAKDLQKTYRNIQVLSCPTVPQELNPKAFKLQLALEHISSDYIAIVDDDTRLSKEGLAQALYSLRHSSKYGLKHSQATIVTGLPYYSDGSNLWSNLVAHFVNNNSIVTYLPLLNFMEPLSINGMFYVMSRGGLERVGGFKTIWQQLSDDFAMARLVQTSGGKIIQTPTTHAVQTSVKDAKHYTQLMHRWFLFAQTQVTEQSLAIRILLGLMLGFPSILLWMIACLSIYSVITLVINQVFLPLFVISISLSLFILIRHKALKYLHKLFLIKPPNFSPALSLLAELLQPLHMLHALVQKNIVWRSRKIRLEKDGRFNYLHNTKS